MKKTIPALILGLLLGGAAAWLYTRATTPAPTPAPASVASGASEHPAPPEKPNPLQLPPAKRAAAGITLIKPTPATLTPEVTAYARVLDTTTLITQASDIDQARVTLDASQKDLDRTQKLHDAGGNASDAQLQTAQATVARDTAALTAAQTKLTATWGRDIAQNAPSLIANLQHGAALVRIDLLPGDTPAPDAKQALLSPAAVLATGTNFPPSATTTTTIIGPAPAADPQITGASYVAIAPTPLPINALLRATLPAPGSPTTALTIPRSAIVYHQGSAWIYILGEEDTFERKLVTLGRALPDDRVAITADPALDPDDQVAATGAQQLLSAELQAGDAAADGD